MPEPIPVLKALQRFLMYCGARNFSPNTVRSYNRDLLQFIRYIGGHNATVAEVNRKAVRAYLMVLSDRKLARASVVRKLASIKSFSKWLAQEGHVQGNPTESFPGPRRMQALPDVPSEKDIRHLLSGKIPTACPERDRVALELLYGSGLRASELVGVNLEDFRGKDALLVRGKGNKERLVPVGHCAQRAIKAWLPVRSRLLAKMNLKTDALLFSVSGNRSVERLDVRSIHRSVKQVATAKGLPPYHPHTLRHCCATHMHDHGAPIQAIAALLGHARLSTAQLYTRVSVGRMMETYRKAHPHAG